MAAECSYNETQFLRLYKTHTSSRPVQDDARRTTVAVEITLTVEGYVTINDSLNGPDETMAEMRKRLSVQGKELRYSEKGFGELIVNSPGSPVRDSAFGPVPEILEWIPLGGEGTAARVTWRVKTTIPECDNALYQFGLMAYNYQATFTIDAENYTTVRVQGYIEIPMTRPVAGDDRRLPDMVDAYADRLVNRAPLGFQRTERSRTVSLDKRRMDFSWTDTELPRALPEKAVKVEARCRVASAPGKAFVQWNVSLTMTVVVARGYKPGEVYGIFWHLFEQRLGSLPRMGANTMFLMPGQFSAEEDVFGRPSTISFSALLVRAGGIVAAMTATKMWQPVDTDYGKWRASLEAVDGMKPGGWAQAGLKASDDLIVDLCANRKPPDYGVKGGKLGPEGERKIEVMGDSDVKVRDLTAETSWVDYDAQVYYLETKNVLRHKPLPADERRLVTAPSPLRTPTGRPLPPQGSFIVPARPVPGAAPAVQDAAKAVGAPSTGGPQAGLPVDVFQRTAGPSRSLTLRGSALRLGYRIPLPFLASVGGIPCVETGRRFLERVAYRFGDLPLFHTSWEITYDIAEAPRGNLPYLSNPAIATTGGTAARANEERSLRT